MFAGQEKRRALSVSVFAREGEKLIYENTLTTTCNILVFMRCGSFAMLRCVSVLRPRSARFLADAVSPYRQMVRVPASQREAWAQKDGVLHSKMREHVPAALAHNGEEAFDNHLVGVQSVLRSWGAAEHLCDAALFHSIYGTEGFQGYKLPLSHRQEIAELIGPKAERLAWIFCMVDRASVDRTVMNPPLPAATTAPSFCARLDLGAFEIPLQGGADGEWLDFITLSLADWLEQVEGAARHANPTVFWAEGGAWAYRRDAYAGMAKLLGERGVDAAPTMYAEVFAREPTATRHLVQPETPPIGVASKEAREALDSAAFDFDAGVKVLERSWAPAPRVSA